MEFSKYLINENSALTDVFDPDIEPLSMRSQSSRKIISRRSFFLICVTLPGSNFVSAYFPNEILMSLNTGYPVAAHFADLSVLPSASVILIQLVGFIGSIAYRWVSFRNIVRRIDQHYFTRMSKV